MLPAQELDSGEGCSVYLQTPPIQLVAETSNGVSTKRSDVLKK